MADKPTPMRRPDPRLSNCVLEGGRSKRYPPPPPPVHDFDFNTELKEGFDFRTGVVVALLMGSLFVVIAVMVALGCDPLRCP